MAIIPTFNSNDLEAMIRGRLEKIERVIIAYLNQIGENFVRNARQNATFKDRTGNLRNSIGFIIVKDGQILGEFFEDEALAAAGIVAEKGVGAATGKVLAATMAADLPPGFGLIVVAGMEYAAAVESKGYDVLTASSLLAEDELKRAIEFLKEEIPKMQ